MEVNQEECVTVREYGEVLKRRRKDRGVTLCELSERTGISQEEIVRVELGSFELSGPQKRKIEKFLRRQPII